ncbi:AAA family ATPase [Niallia endozanthoxylica]|uniref:AAA domain-containing protein n=1 Tax=Niallia endozanthoxylica TaxID=2036016 RepID=A0A5J5GVT1_9BACI|nr:AAA family ATPase [Niallia endozanthoxylica]KAA9011512.1 AAA domain-containing protein [Niallia endozanthoxylica]
MNKIQKIKKALNKKYYERENEIEAMLTAILARQHVLLIGPAGTGKSALSAELSKIIKDCNYFQWLLTRFSTPEELFGVLSLTELEKGIYKRNTTSKLPEAHFVFLDEIFKANSAILNSLLTLINERLFYNGEIPIKSPLMSVIGSSNEYPDEGEGLEALFDRFLLRFEVKYVNDTQNFISMLQGNTDHIEIPSMTMNELLEYQFMTDMMNIPYEVYQILVEIRLDLLDEGIRPSDRRFKQSLSLLKAKAFMEGRQQVERSDIMLLQNTLWETIEQKDVTVQIVKENAQDKFQKLIEDRKQEVNELQTSINRDSSVEERIEVRNKLLAIQNELDEVYKQQQHPMIPELSANIRGFADEIANNILNV